MSFTWPSPADPLTAFVKDADDFARTLRTNFDAVPAGEDRDIARRLLGAVFFGINEALCEMHRRGVQA